MKAHDKATRLAEHEGLCSVASNTKWRRLLASIEKFHCNKRVKWIDNPEPTRWQIGMWQPHPDFVEASGGPEELKFVEWIEIERVERRHMGRLVPAKLLDHSDQIRATLDAERVTFEEEEDSFRILGYSRPGTEAKA
ncbi:DUF6678 family protein [Haloferula sp.]|uniref:DUF6678 family protein n=1 Tax=Haloferula sp. TaxID=2497595 RepID=UPI00329DB07A